ncbi:hypothetical protein [Litorihabitans aurantiacus]|uniref:Uncharacterized protein n=1 Tax=Litorihabitans aurantiacus TaxID=1930061 RepID=A0AA37XAS9_9MICO|nr:hypothetical protein [Litorihabitans aurantiacus]GMA30434.1 hypothetical protein GCM10025875_04260 [Litorihabitans aurantiacus]
MRPPRTRSLTVAAALASLLLLSGCGTPPWEIEQDPTDTDTATSSEESSSSASTSPSESDTATASPSEDATTTGPPEPGETPEPQPTLTQVVNDLQSGSTERTLTAGAATLTATYWSDLNMADWTPDASKPVSLSLTAQENEDAPAYLARLHVTSVARDESGALVSQPPDLVDDATVQPGYTIEDPYSYSTTVLVPPLPEEARSVELTFSYEILIATTPRAQAFSKQTATDRITVAIAPPAGS